VSAEASRRAYARPRRFCALVALVGTACSRATPGADVSVDPAAAQAPMPTARGEGNVRQVAARPDVPLTGLRVDARPGDWMLENAGQVAVVDAHGRIVDFGASGHDDALVAIEPVVSLGLDDLPAEIVSVGPTPGAPAVVRIERRVLDAALRLYTFVSFSGPALRIESMAISDGAGSGPVTLGEKVGWGNVPTWVEGTGFVTHGGAFSGGFIAREGLGQAYALGAKGARITARFDAPQASGFHARAHTGEEAVRIAPGGASPRREIWLAHAEGSIGEAVDELLRAQGVALSPLSLPGTAASWAHAEVASCAATGQPEGAPFARFALQSNPRGATLPAGCFEVRATAPGFTPGSWTALDDVARGSEAFEPRAGRLRWHVTDASGTTIPARLMVRGIATTADPDWGEDPHDGASLEAIATLGDGDIAIPAGRYRVAVSRGFEYTTDERTITIANGGTTLVGATLERVVDTRGWISADLHVHAVPSPDAPVLLEDRVRSLAASGVEVAAATDHNAVTDYAPTVRALGAQRWLASMVGDEVTTRGIELGHFNVFPLMAGDAPLPYEGTTPHDIFAAARAARPGDRDKVVQVNHPRMGSIGYFELLHLDPADFDAWRARSPLFDASFDALEVFNGDDYSALDRVQTCLRDWYALLNAGIHVTATGNSDSHKMTYQEPGVPRNFVRVRDDTPAAFDERGFVEAVRHGRVVVSSGPFVHLVAGGGEVGDTIAAGESVAVQVHVEAPPWVDVATVELLRRGEVVQTWQPKTSSAAVRLDETIHLALRPGDWVVAIARGAKPMAFLHRPGALPFGFTNPVYVR
jgi:hypothetical protein